MNPPAPAAPVHHENAERDLRADSEPGNGAARARSSVDNIYWFMLAAGRATPDKAAIVELTEADDEFKTVSYRQLEQQILQFAAELETLGLDVGDRVVLESNTSACTIALFLACAWLGLTFIPVGPETPADRLLSIIEAARPALHLQPAEGHRDGIPAQVGTMRFGAHGLTIERPPGPRTRHRREVLPTDPAYIIFTSGTTGRPKGVVMSHRAVIAFYRGVLQEGMICAGDRIAITAPFQFDFSLAGIGLALGGGATVVLVPPNRIGWPKRFVSFLRDSAVTQVHGVPSIWRNVLRDEPERLAGLAELHHIVFSGEEFPLHELRRLQQLLPKAHLVNGYGATESMACSVTKVPNPIPDDLTTLSIGFAHAGAEMMILDEKGQPIESPGITGEIYLRSPALFTGYWDDPQGTREVLVPDPLNPGSGQIVFRSGDLAYRGRHGELYFCGRIDSQVKIRGNRVELGELERLLTKAPGVAVATALLLPRPDGELALTAFVVMKPGSPAPDKRRLRAFCAAALPSYMIPGKIGILDELPLTGNGKIDRAALADHFNSRWQDSR
jgi:amino acid adenylation domain-containing protein